jgi:hypothetical protein
VGVDFPPGWFTTIDGTFAPRPIPMVERVHVANRDNLSVGLLEKFVDQIESSRTGANDSDSDVFVGRSRLRISEYRIWNEDRSCETSQPRSSRNFELAAVV